MVAGSVREIMTKFDTLTVGGPNWLGQRMSTFGILTDADIFFLIFNFNLSFVLSTKPE